MGEQAVTYLRFDAQGIHFAEMFQQQGAVTALPGLLPDELSAGDEWDEELVSAFPHLERED